MWGDEKGLSERKKPIGLVDCQKGCLQKFHFSTKITHLKSSLRVMLVNKITPCHIEGSKPQLNLKETQRRWSGSDCVISHQYFGMTKT